MTARDLRELLADVPDHWEVGIEVVIGEDTDVLPIAGPSDTRWTHTLALIVDDSTDKYVKLSPAGSVALP